MTTILQALGNNKKLLDEMLKNLKPNQGLRVSNAGQVKTFVASKKYPQYSKRKKKKE